MFKKFFTVWFLLYGLLYIFPFPLASSYTWGSSFQDNYVKFWINSAHLLNLFPHHHTSTPNEIDLSGDCYYHFFKSISFFFLSLILVPICLKYRILKKQLYDHGFTLIRLFVATSLIAYGMAKVMPVQFTQLSLLGLYQPVGEMSPMNLLWTFMTYSQPYYMFSGWLELIAGILMFIPRTFPAGAFLSAIVLSNVFLLNIFFDVPVKLLSFHLLFFSISLSFQYIKATIQLLLSLRIPNISISFGKSSASKFGYILQVFILVLTLYFTHLEMLEIISLKEKWKTNEQFYGLWTIEINF